jgi:RNA polymerase sigma factor (sigma-70 family)
MSVNHLLPHADQLYIEALIRHDQRLIEAIYENYADGIKGFILANGGTIADAGDVFQDALADIYRQGQRGFVLTCSFKTFFFTVCRNKWFDELRKRGRAEVTIQGIERLEGEDSEQAVQAFYLYEKRQALLAEVLRQLGPSCQNIFNLTWSVNPETGKYFSLIEVAARLELSYAYLRKKKSECEQTLREKMKASPEFIKLKGE